MKIGIVVGIVLLLVTMACAANAAQSPEVSLEATDMPIEQAMADLEKQAGVQIMCASGVKANVTGHFESIELENLLDTITKLSQLKWQKVYLPTQDEQKPTLEQVTARAEAIAAVTGGPIAIYDPATGKQKVFVEQSPSAPSIETEKLGLKPIYLISKPKTEVADPQSDKKDSVARLQSIQEERVKLLTQMSPEERVQALQQEMTYTMQMTPSARQQMMLDQMKARQSIDPQVRDTMRQQMREDWRYMREQGLVPEGTRGPDRGRNRGGGTDE